MPADFVPGVVAALAFGASNVFGKIAFGSGADGLTLITFRGFVGIGFVWTWLHFSPAPSTHSQHALNVSLALGL